MSAEEDRKAFDEWFTSLSDGHAAFDVWKRGLSEAWQAALAYRDRQPRPVARHATETVLDFESEIEYLKELDARKETLPAPPAPEAAATVEQVANRTYANLKEGFRNAFEKLAQAERCPKG